MIGENDNTNEIKNQIEMDETKKEKIEKDLNKSTTHSNQTKRKVNCRSRGKCFCCCFGKIESDGDISDNPSLSSASISKDNVIVVELTKDQTLEVKQKKELPNCFPQWIISRFACYQNFNLSNKKMYSTAQFFYWN